MIKLYPNLLNKIKKQYSKKYLKELDYLNYIVNHNVLKAFLNKNIGKDFEKLLIEIKLKTPVYLHPHIFDIIKEHENSSGLNKNFKIVNGILQHIEYKEFDIPLWFKECIQENKWRINFYEYIDKDLFFQLQKDSLVISYRYNEIAASNNYNKHNDCEFYTDRLFKNKEELNNLFKAVIEFFKDREKGTSAFFDMSENTLYVDFDDKQKKLKQTLIKTKKSKK